MNISKRELDLSWDCLFPPEIKSKMEYRIYLKNDDGYVYKTETRKCDMKITLEILSDVCLKVIPVIKNEECQYLSSEKCIHFERNGTLAENVSCRVYNTSSMACTWMFGKNAPPNTSYILFLRQKPTSLQCQQYETDFQARTGACTFHDLRVNFFEDITIVLQGLDPETEVFEEQTQLAQIEIFNPPRDISVTSFNDSITINWESPQIQYNVGDKCFEYLIEKNK
ncbi:interleukin-5 receptor subunit alpha-like, partial [Mantella aurantiaca]